MAIACPDCGTIEDIPALPFDGRAMCRTCEADLEKRRGRTVSAALACSLAAFLLLFPGNILPLLEVDIFGMQSHNVIFGGIADLWSQQWLWLAGISALLVIALPFVRFGLLTAVLGSLKLGLRPAWLGPAFRWAQWLDVWAMSDVYLLASFVGYYRLSHVGQAHIFIQVGGACFMAAAFLTMLSRASLDQRTVWRAIGPEASVTPGQESLSCTTCDLVQPLSCNGCPCPRCGARLRPRKADSMARTTALLVTAFVLFFPANIFPMNTSFQLGQHHSYTIYAGVRDLFQSGLWPLGALIFCTSILIPMGKILVMGWCLLSVRLRSKRHLIFKTKLFRVTAELGRWSKTDPFTIVFFVPLMKFGPMASAHAGWGATAFTLMTVLTMLASLTFDPRLMWDAAQDSP